MSSTPPPADESTKTETPSTQEDASNTTTTDTPKARRNIDEARTYAAKDEEEEAAPKKKDDDENNDKTTTEKQPEDTPPMATPRSHVDPNEPPEDAPEEETTTGSNPPPDPRDESSGKPLEVKTVVIKGDVVEFYPSERTNMNLALKANVEEAYNAYVEQCAKHVECVVAMKGEEDESKAPIEDRWKEFREGYQWPELPAKTGVQFADDSRLKYDPAALVRISTTLDQVKAQLDGDGHTSLRAIRSYVNLLATLETHKEKLAVTCGALFEESERSLPEDVLIPLHKLVFSDQFAFVKSELQRIASRMGPIVEELEKVSEAKHDAEVLEDIPSIESLSYRQITLQEQILELAREALRTVYDCAEDAATFRQNYAELREKAEEKSTSINEKLQADLQNLDEDMEKLAEEADAEEKRIAEYDATFNSFLKSNDEEQKAVADEQRQLWEQIQALMKKNDELANRQKTLAGERAERIAQHRRTKKEYDSFCEGFDALSNDYSRAREANELSTQWLSSVNEYVTHMCEEIERKDVEEEALGLRVDEQLKYLQHYAHFKDFSDELTHRKETRSAALQRMNRSLEMQIKTASASLDPNRRKYEAEQREISQEHDKMKDQLTKLNQRSLVQKEHWMPVEQSLEDEGVDFDPPDLIAEQTRLARKSDTLNQQRKFVSVEQETVDRDTMSLRKLKTSTKVAVEGHEQRKEERQKQKQDQIEDNTNQSPDKTNEDTSPSSPKEEETEETTKEEDEPSKSKEEENPKTETAETTKQPEEKPAEEEKKQDP